MKNILYVHNGKKIGGGERSLLALFKGIDHKQYHVFVACPDGTPFADALKKAKIEFFPFQFFGARNILKLMHNVFRLKELINTKKIDFVHSNSPQTNLPAALAGKLCRIPVIWHARVLLEKGMLDIDRIFSYLPSKIVCNTNAISQRFTGIKDFVSKVVVVVNGVDVHDFSPEHRSIKKEREILSLPQNQTIIGCFDRLDPVKNHEFVLEALAILRQSVPNVILLIVGEAFCNKEERLESLKAKMRELGLNDAVRFEGFVDDVRGAVMACDVIVQASISEGCSRALLEAQAMGKPVVASNVGGNPQIIEDGKTGFLFDITDPKQCTYKLVLLLANDVKRQIMGASARQWAVEQLSLEKHCKKTEAIYKGLVEN